MYENKPKIDKLLIIQKKKMFSVDRELLSMLFLEISEIIFFLEHLWWLLLEHDVALLFSLLNT